ncbi:DNA-3-methyladenine glycosylase II [Melghirimyces algeriensis]|uniref:DNA-3-methyladenine glycosylase II n=2 Tax=Melghirimyces algeriensis TaxID=910412 RepID=A0A521E065_9BACL|nr:DNA-3-methyladenine glycosylase II [Melghirimyces algeriensis]
MVEWHFSPKEPYSFEATIRRLVRFDKMLYRYRNGLLYRTLWLKDRPVTICLEWEAGQIRVQAEESLSEQECEILKGTIRRMFSLDVELQPFYDCMKKEPDLAPIIESRRGLHLVLDPTLYECLIKTIISQQLNLSFAGKLVHRLVKFAGDSLVFQGEELPVFPAPDQVARLNVEDLQKLSFNRRKAEYVIDLSRDIVEGKLDLDSLKQLPNEEVIERLVALRGVGRWTVECILLFGMGRTNLLPAADIGLRNALKKVYGLNHQPTEAEVRQWGERWSPWRSYVTFYLWDYLSNG